MLNNLKKHKDRNIILFLIILSLVINYSWLNFNIFSFSDYGYRTFRTLDNYLNLSSWLNIADLGNSNVLLWRAPLLIGYSLFGKLGFNINVAEKFLLFWPWLILAPLSSYLFVKQYIKSLTGRIIGSFVFTYNTYFLAINTQGHINISLAACIGLLSLYSFNKLHDTRKVVYIYLTAIALFVMGVYDLRVLYLFILINAFLYIAKIAIIEKKKKLFIYSSMRRNLLVLVVFFLLNIYWILPIFAGNSFNENGILDRSLFGDVYWDFQSALTLFHPFWNFKEPIWFKTNPVPYIYYSIPLAVLFGFILGKQKKILIVFLILAILGIFFAKQSDPPFENLYYWLFIHFPGFNAFREATKFYIPIIVAYSVLIGVFVDSLIYLRTRFRFIQNLTIFGIAIIFIFNTLPILNGSIGSMHRTREVPYEYIYLNDLLDRDNSFSRILFIPTFPKWIDFTNNHPSVSIVDLLLTEWVDFTTSNTPTISERIKIFFEKEISPKLINQTSIKYIVIPPYDLEPKDNFYKFYGAMGTRKYYVNLLDKNLNYKKYQIGDMIIYKNEHHMPHIYLTYGRESVASSSTFKKINYKRIMPTIYHLTLGNNKESYFINFTEKYSPNWKITLGHQSWISLLFNDNAILDKNHMKNLSGTNAFYLDSNLLNTASSKAFYTIYYEPDLYYYVGCIISGIAILFIMIYFIMLGIKKLKHS